MTITAEFEHFRCLKVKTSFFEKRKSFLKNWSKVFQLKALLLKKHYFHAKLPCQKPMLGQIEWGVKKGSITKNAVLPLTTLFFWKFNFSIRTSNKQLISRTNFPNAHIHIFRKRLSFVWRRVFPVSRLNILIFYFGIFRMYEFGIMVRNRSKTIPPKFQKNTSRGLLFQ